MNNNNHSPAFPLMKLVSRLLLLGALLLTTLPQPAAAQTIAPPECLTDQGQSLMPSQPDSWILVLNFNHQPASDYTTGCIIYRASAEPKVSYDRVHCPLHNNRNGVAVGNGVADFDGHFWIECTTPQTRSDLTQFNVEATARFSQPGGYTIVDHPSVAWSAAIGVDWRVTQESRYGATRFQHHDSTTIAYGQDLHLKSDVQEKLGAHAVNGAYLYPEAPVEAFDFAQQPLTIGGQEQAWTLHELIVDPPGVCCTRR